MFKRKVTYGNSRKTDLAVKPGSTAFGKAFGAENLERMAGQAGQAAGLAALIPGIGTLPAIGLGSAAAFLTGYSMFGPEASKKAIIGRDKTVDGEYNVGYIGRILDALDGEENALGLDQQSLRSTENKMLRRDINSSDFGALAQERGLRAPRDGETLSQYRRSLGPDMKKAERKDKFEDPYLQTILQEGKTERAMLRADRQMAADRSFELDVSRQQERVDARMGQQDLMNLQLLQNQRQFDSELSYRQDESRRDRTANLIGALSNLGAAFVI